MFQKHRGHFLIILPVASPLCRVYSPLEPKELLTL